MSSEIYEFDEWFFNHPFSPFNDSSTIDILQSLQEDNYNYTPLVPPSSSPPLTTHENLENQFEEIDQITPTQHSSSSPPINQLENLSLYQMGIYVNTSNESLDFPPLEVKIEESQLPLQRSYSSNSFQQGKSKGVFYQPKIDGLIESSNLHSVDLTSPDHCFSSTHMRRVCSTGDLQSQKVNQISQRLSSSPLAKESSFLEETNFKVGSYNVEERKEKILRYRAKRTQRNFNKTIKYACRKTLADNRPRIRGRFARNDELGELPKTTNFHRYRNDDELWMDGFHDDDDGLIGQAQFFNTYSSISQCQQFNFFYN